MSLCWKNCCKCQLVIQPARLLTQICTSQRENLPSKFGSLRHLLTCQDCLPIIIMPSAHGNVWLFVHGGLTAHPQCLSWSSVTSYYVGLRTHKAYTSQLQIPCQRCEASWQHIGGDSHLHCMIHSFFSALHERGTERVKVTGVFHRSLPELSLFTSTDVASQWQPENFILLGADVWRQALQAC